jgi:CO/xanthine dehydrogenase Mo-binding subunit
MNRPLLPFLLAALALAACATGAMSTAARDTLAKTAGCPTDQVKVEELGDSKYRATGCQRSETYVCKVAEHAVVSCVPEASVPPFPDAR